jgi:hypothetical protein
MSTSRSQPALPRNHRALVVVAAAAAPALAACAGAGPPTTLSATSAAPPAPTPGISSPPASPSVQQQVIAARTSYTVAVGEAEKSRNGAEARSLLRPYLAAARINDLVQTMQSIWARGEIFYGEDVLHIKSVTVKGSTAFVYDCDDTSSAGLEYSATGQVVPGSGGIPHMNVITRLSLEGGRWLVQFQTIVDEACTA